MVRTVNWKRVTCQSGIKGWQGHLQDQYNDQDEFEWYSENYGLAERLGFVDAATAWNENPLVQGSVIPEDFCRVA